MSPKTKRIRLTSVKLQQLDDVNGGIIIEHFANKNALVMAHVPTPQANVVAAPVTTVPTAALANVVNQPTALGTQTFNAQVLAALLGMVNQQQAAARLGAGVVPRAVAVPHNNGGLIPANSGWNTPRYRSRDDDDDDNDGGRAWRAARSGHRDRTSPADRGTRSRGRGRSRDRGRDRTQHRVSDRDRNQSRDRDSWDQFGRHDNRFDPRRDNSRDRGRLNPFGGNTYSNHGEVRDARGNLLSTRDSRMYTDRNNRPQLSIDSIRERGYRYDAATNYRDGRPVATIERQRDANGYGAALHQYDRDGNVEHTIGVDCNNQNQCRSYDIDRNGRVQESIGDRFGFNNPNTEPGAAVRALDTVTSDTGTSSSMDTGRAYAGDLGSGSSSYDPNVDAA